VRIVVDGRDVEAREGQLLIDVVDVPHLCHDEKLEPSGGCRLCTVSVEGLPRPVPACATRVAEGMVVSTNGGTARLRETVASLILEDLRLSTVSRQSRGAHEDENRFIGFDPDLCVLCDRCVRYAREVAQCSALSVTGKGLETRISTTAGRSFLDTECELCGGCVSVCPTGALHAKKARGTVARSTTRTTCSYCGVGCQLDLHVAEGRIVEVTSKRGYLPNDGDLCVKGRFAYDFVHSPERLAHPLVRGADGVLHEASWEDAIAAAAAGLLRVRHEHGPQAVGIVSSARLTIEENFLIQKLARTAVGTNSVHSCEAT
jgi:predicted molibdopterin-dependent oxidoreductase YjgC